MKVKINFPGKVQSFHFEFPILVPRIQGARINRFDCKACCPFCGQVHEKFEHIFQCNSGILCRKSLRGTTLYKSATMKDIQETNKIGKLLVKYQKYTKIFCGKIVLWHLTFQGFNYIFLMDL